MAIETWSAGLNGAGIRGRLTGNGMIDTLTGAIDYDAKPEGEGWQITGYRTQSYPTNSPNGNQIVSRAVPVYSRVKADAAAAPAPAPAPTPRPAPIPAVEPQLNTTRIEQAKDAAAPYITAYATAKRPSLYGSAASASDPYRAVDQYGLDANELFSKLIERNEAVAKQQTSEMGAALDYQAQRFTGAVPKLQDWRKYYDPLKSDIQNA